MYQLTTVGDIKLDVFIDLGNAAKKTCTLDKKACELSIRYGQKTPVQSAVTMTAGSAPNVAIGARRLGLSTAIVSIMGDDAASSLAISSLKKEGISTDTITIEPGSESSFAAILNFEGESTMLAMHRPFAYRWPANMKTEWVMVSELGSTYKKLFTQLTEAKQEGRIQLAINPGTLQLEQRSKQLMNLIAVCDVLFVNKDEAQRLVGDHIDDLEVLLTTLLELGVDTVVMTDGRDGSYAARGKERHFAPMFPGERVEATGAGDAFMTGALAALITGESLATALTWGSVNAASVVQFVGAQEGLLTRAQIASDLTQYTYKTTKL